MITRRRFVRNASVVSAALAVAPGAHLALAQAEAGGYHNPIMGGDHPDGSPIRVGDDFYLTQSSFDYAPGPLSALTAQAKPRSATSAIGRRSTCRRRKA